MGLRRAVLKRGHREGRLRSSGVLDEEEVALRSWGFREEQNKTQPESRFKRKACHCLGKEGVGGSCSEEQSRELQIESPEVMGRRPQVSCGPAVQETPHPITHSGKIPKVL